MEADDAGAAGYILALLYLHSAVVARRPRRRRRGEHLCSTNRPEAGHTRSRHTG